MWESKIRIECEARYDEANTDTRCRGAYREAERLIRERSSYIRLCLTCTHNDRGLYAVNSIMSELSKSVGMHLRYACMIENVGEYHCDNVLTVLWLGPYDGTH